jgi:hypothetical protein
MLQNDKTIRDYNLKSGSQIFMNPRASSEVSKSGMFFFFPFLFTLHNLQIGDTVKRDSRMGGERVLGERPHST